MQKCKQWCSQLLYYSRKTLLSEIFEMQFDKWDAIQFPASQVYALSLLHLFLRDGIKNILQCFIIYNVKKSYAQVWIY